MCLRGVIHLFTSVDQSSVICAIIANKHYELIKYTVWTRPRWVLMNKLLSHMHTHTHTLPTLTIRRATQYLIIIIIMFHFPRKLFQFVCRYRKAPAFIISFNEYILLGPPRTNNKAFLGASWTHSASVTQCPLQAYRVGGDQSRWSSAVYRADSARILRIYYHFDCI